MQHLEGQLKGTGPERDFLAEATSLALQLDPVSWEFDFSDRDFDDIAEITEGQKSCISNSALPKVYLHVKLSSSSLAESKTCKEYNQLKASISHVSHPIQETE